MVNLSELSIASLPRMESFKRTIHRHKSVDQDSTINRASASYVLVPDRYMITLKDETFLIYDSGIGDTDRMLIFSTPKMLSLLQESQSWFRRYFQGCTCILYMLKSIVSQSLVYMLC